MRYRRSFTCLLFFSLLTLVMPLQADNQAAMKEDNEHIRRWRAFAQNSLELHKKLVKQQAVTKKTSIGGYSHLPNYYQEEQFFSKRSGKLISRVRWNREDLKELHTIEVFIYDDKNRVVRDYSAAYLPHYRNAPNQTLISLHAYNNGTHAFRTFDATGDHILDRCEGNLAGKKVNILLDEDELYEGQGEENGVMQSQTYKVCTKGLPQQAGKYLTPQ